MLLKVRRANIAGPREAELDIRDRRERRFAGDDGYAGESCFDARGGFFPVGSSRAGREPSRTFGE